MSVFPEVKQYVKSLEPSVMGSLLYHLVPYRRKVVLANMETAFGDTLNIDDRVKLAKAFYGHYARCFKENVLMHLTSLSKLKKKVDIQGVEHVARALDEGKGLLLLTGHMGNWEFAPIAGISHFELLKGRFYFLRRTLKAKWIEDILFRRYFKSGLKVIAGKNRVEKACDALEEKNAVVFVMDQHAQTRIDGSKEGVAAPFFSKKAGTYRSLAIVHGYTQSPLLPVCAYRKKDGTHVLKFYPKLDWQDTDSRKEDILTNTTRYNRQLEKIIAAHPEQWNWIHKRWKKV